MKPNKRKKMIVISLNLESELVKKIDKKRNGIPRSPYVNKILKRVIR